MPACEEFERMNLGGKEGGRHSSPDLGPRESSTPSRKRRGGKKVL